MFWSGAELNTLYNNAQQNVQVLRIFFIKGWVNFSKAPRFYLPNDRRYRTYFSLSRDQSTLEYGLGTLASLLHHISAYLAQCGESWMLFSCRWPSDFSDGCTGYCLIATAIGLFAAIPAVLAFLRLKVKASTLTAHYLPKNIIATSICGFITGRCIMAIQGALSA